jgi:hypothetical protein
LLIARALQRLLGERDAAIHIGAWRMAFVGASGPRPL